MIAKFLSNARAIGAFVFVILVLSGCFGEMQQLEATNKVVIIIDASGSYQARATGAIAKATQLLTQIAGTKLHRWEAGNDSISVISLDAIPSVLWQGNLRDLQAVDSSQWASLFHSRRDYSCCSDVGTAFKLAASHLQGDPNVTGKFLFGFTDGIDEPPTSSFCKCKNTPLSAPPPDGFPWESFRDVSVSLFWFPPDQKLAWSRAAKAKGMASFAIYTDSESEAAVLQAPPRPQIVVSDSARAAMRTKIQRLAMSVLKWGGLGFAALVLLVVGLTFLAISRGRRFRR